MRITRTFMALTAGIAASVGALAIPSAVVPSVSAATAAPRVILTTTNDVAHVASRCTYLVNVYRHRYGLAPVRIDARVQLAAQKHSNYQSSINTMTHQGRWVATRDAGLRMTLQGYTWSWWGENVAAGQANCDVVVKAWMNSPHHRENILNPHFTNIGVAARKSTYGVLFWTMDLGRPL